MELRNFIIGYLILPCACVSFGQTAVPETTACETRAAEPSHATAAEQTRLAQRFVDDKVAVWRQRLKLENWRISAVMAHQSDLVPKTLGAIKWDKSKKTAVIWVLDPSEYRLSFCDALNDMELTVVHELLHLELTSLPRSQASRSNEEHAVNGIAEAMLGLDRKKP